jgi:hypothetical protein
MKQISEVFVPLIGRLVWNVRRGHGSFLTLEVGEPHLSVREPINSASSSARVRSMLRRRRVFVVGDWHFWVKYGEWELSTASGVLGSRTSPGSPNDERLGELDGQKLHSVGHGRLPGALVLTFDLGAKLEIWPSAEIPDDQWCLHGWDGNIAACQADGTLVFEKAAPDKER